MEDLGINPEKENFWKDKNVFITGCSGFLGSWLTIELVNRGANVIGLVRDWVPKSYLFLSGYKNKINIVWGTIENFELIERTLNEYEIDTCFHLAAQTIVSIANNSPLSTFESNIKGTWILLEALRHCKTIKRIIIASSDKAYGEHTQLPYLENFALKGKYPYDVSKSCADLIAQTYYHTYKLPLAITRCANFYGGGDLNFNRIVPGTIKSILFNQSPIIRSDGDYIRDYLYIKDAVKAYLRLAENLQKEEVQGEAFNFGTDTPIKVLELVKKILKISDSNHLKPIILGEVKSEIKVQYLDSSKAEKILGWKPIYDLDTGLQETILWYKDFFGL